MKTIIHGFACLCLCKYSQAKGGTGAAFLFPQAHSRSANTHGANGRFHPSEQRRAELALSAAKKRRSGAMSRKDLKTGPEPPILQDDVIDVTSDNSPEEPTGSIYSLPALYDLAFGYRDFEEEVEFLLTAHKNYASASPESSSPLRILELAAGPARHSLTALSDFSTFVGHCSAVDTSSEMKEYSEGLSKEILSSDRQGDFEYCTQDIRDFSLADKSSVGEVDSAWLLLGSMAHLTTNDDVISCFQNISKYLKPNGGGTLIIELPHPRENFMMMECTRNSWEVPLSDENEEDFGKLKIIWGDENDPFDPITQLRDFTIQMELEGGAAIEKMDGKASSVREVVPMRLFTAQEVNALARCSGFEIVKMYGALDSEVDVGDDDGAYRLVCVMRTL